jgi:hydroxyacylglutathione hydrolase
MPLEIVTVPCLSDNYAYLLHDRATGATAVVDVPDADAVEKALSERGWTLTDILVTHHHPDHIDGVDALRAATGARVTGARADAHRLPALDRAVAGEDSFEMGSVEVHVLDVPGHTVGHIAFHIPAAQAVFTADSLMGLGCGRLFEGTPEQMWQSLSDLAALPSGTMVYPGHEYTEANARFALTIEPRNRELISHAERVRAARAGGKPTVPATLAEELATNPFLRARLPEVKAAIGRPGATDAEAFAEIRRRKDVF